MSTKYHTRKMSANYNDSRKEEATPKSISQILEERYEDIREIMKKEKQIFG